MIGSVSLGAASGVNVTRTETGMSATPSAGPAATTRAAQLADFSSVLAHVSATTVESVRGGEAAAISGIQGKASVQQVVEAVMAAEQSLQTAIAVRDKVVAAYQEISRMTI